MSKPLCRNDRFACCTKIHRYQTIKERFLCFQCSSREKIKAILREQKSVTVLELMEYFNVTNETIRRDLLALEEEGFVSRGSWRSYIEGGTTNEINISLRRTTHSAQKQQIAAVCERIIQNGDSIFLDSSTTANYIAEKLTNYRLTVLTNSIQIINTLASFSGIIPDYGRRQLR